MQLFHRIQINIFKFNTFGEILKYIKNEKRCLVWIIGVAFVGLIVLGFVLWV